MKEFLTYTLQVSILLSVSYLVLRSIFSNNISPYVKRFVLLTLSLLSFVLPLCRITILQTVAGTSLSDDYIASRVESTASVIEENLSSINSTDDFDGMLIWVILYCIGVCVVLLYQAIGLCKIYKLTRHAKSIRSKNDHEIFILPFEIQPCSFLGKIIISQKDYLNNPHIILYHETAHIKEKHSLDLLFFNCVVALQWFNPLAWLIRREMILTHEYCADSRVIKSGIDAKTYQYLLITKSSTGKGFMSATSNLGYGSLHKRITAMKRHPKKISSMKSLVIIPLVGISLMAFSRVEYRYLPAHPKSASGADTTINVRTPTFSNPVKGTATLKGKYTADKHIGIDIVASNDTVFAVSAGTVKSMRYDKAGSGNCMTINTDSMEIRYAHLSKFLVAPNAQVGAGEPIAIMGSTGRSTGKHLHLELECKINGQNIDPQLVMAF